MTLFPLDSPKYPNQNPHPLLRRISTVLFEYFDAVSTLFGVGVETGPINLVVINEIGECTHF